MTFKRSILKIWSTSLMSFCGERIHVRAEPFAKSWSTLSAPLLNNPEGGTVSFGSLRILGRSSGIYDVGLRGAGGAGAEGRQIVRVGGDSAKAGADRQEFGEFSRD